MVEVHAVRKATARYCRRRRCRRFKEKESLEHDTSSKPLRTTPYRNCNFLLYTVHTFDVFSAKRNTVVRPNPKKYYSRTNVRNYVSLYLMRRHDKKFEENLKAPSPSRNTQLSLLMQ